MTCEHSLAGPKAPRTAQTDSSLTTRSKFTIHFRIDPAPGDANTTRSIPEGARRFGQFASALQKEHSGRFVGRFRRAPPAAPGDCLKKFDPVAFLPNRTLTTVTQLCE